MKKNWRLSVEEKFENFSKLVIKHRLKTLVFLLLIVVYIASNLPKITFDTSTEGFLYKDDPQIVMYDAFRNQFGRDEKIVIAIKTKDVFNKEFLKKLFTLHKDIEENLPYIKEVTSLKNARKTIGNKNELIVEDLFQNSIPEDAKELEKIKKFVKNNQIYQDLYINKDATFTTIMISTNTYTSLGSNNFDPLLEGFDEQSSNKKLDFITVEETNELISKLEHMLKKYEADNFKIYDAGSPIVTKNLQTSLMKDMSTFILYVVLTIAILLFLTFKKISGIIIPLFVVILTLLSTIGLMALFGYPITSMTQILPSLLLAVSIGDSIHILSIFYHKYDESGDKNLAISYAISHSGLAVFMTSVTTAASLASFAISDIAPVAALGIFSAIGVTIALIFTIVFIPIMLSLFPIKHRVKDEDSFLDAFMIKVANFSINYYKSIVASSLIVIVVSLVLASQMHFSHNPLHWFKKDNNVRVNTQTIDKELRGSISIEVVLDTKKENGVYNPEFLNKIQKVTKEIYTYKGENYFIGKIVTINDVLKEINMALNENKQEFYKIPQNQKLIAQEFLLFENSGSDDLEDIVDNRFSKTRISIKAPWVDSVEYVELIKKLETLLNTEFKDLAEISITGTLPILSTTITKSIESSIESYIIAFGVIALLLVVLIGSFKLGFLSMIPNLTPIMFALAFMVFYNLPLDMFTILIGAIAIGMVVDDTIHYMHNFKRYYIVHKNIDEAIRLTLHSTGRAILITSVVLSSGFLVFMFASMNNLFNFGLITGITVLVAMFTNLVLSGSLIKMFLTNR
ncbi:MMPL family transporter [Sulfurimonas lithotrophica]|uniref:MMPL family transporter n=1 Tax=Sulfurimonas lithotrophica TaxID=2590022 RepID=A0A5P8P3G3_9BACT|nr:MMPL family transporter [Sulfurimonas lithotrophica]QFR50137.1 MMPL family transporter [Sulfurimonas lithotrophica]